MPCLELGIMKKFKFIRIFQPKNLWITVLLIAANGLAWFQVAGRGTLPQADPVLHPEIAEIRAHWQARDAVGEPFSVVISDQMAMETIAWFIEPRPDLPISHPFVEIHPDRVVGGSLLHLLGLRTLVKGEVTVWVENGKLTGQVESVQVAGTAAPDFVVDAVQQAQALYDDLSFPITITTLELRKGEVLIEGVYR
jgi:hypothetical protein